MPKELEEGSIVRLKSGTEGWVKGRVVEYTDLMTYPPLGAAIYTGPGYKVYILEGKHKGETMRMPENYVEPYKTGREPIYPHTPKRQQPLFPHVPKTLQQTKEKLYQRGPDGYPIGADKIMRDAWGAIPATDQPFWSGKGFIKPVKIYGWQWSPDYHSWRAYVRFPDGTETWTSPLKLPATEKLSRNDVEVYLSLPPYKASIWVENKETEKTIWELEGAENIDRFGWKDQNRDQLEESVLKHLEDIGVLSLDLMASTEGDPIRKFCCRICGECAPKELLEEGKFLDRITWLRSHYQAKHPGMWGKMSPMTIVDGEPVSPQYRHLTSLVSEPLPEDAY